MGINKETANVVVTVGKARFVASPTTVCTNPSERDVTSRRSAVRLIAATAIVGKKSDDGTATAHRLLSQLEGVTVKAEGFDIGRMKVEDVERGRTTALDVEDLFGTDEDDDEDFVDIGSETKRTKRAILRHFVAIDGYRAVIVVKATPVKGADKAPDGRVAITVEVRSDGRIGVATDERTTIR